MWAVQSLARDRGSSDPECMSPSVTAQDHLEVGSLLYEGLDQIDLTGPFEVLARMPNTTHRLYGTTRQPVRDIHGLVLTPDAVLADAPPLDVLGATGLLRGRRATTHWASVELLPSFGAIPVDARVVVDREIVSAAGVTAGIDGALQVAAILRGDAVAQSIQLLIQYAPQPPFDAGTPETAPAPIVAAARQAMADITATRKESAGRVAARLGVLPAVVAGPR